MTTIDKLQLFEIPHYLRGPNQMYDLCMGDNMRLDVCDALEYTDYGWEVYTTERGGKYDVRVFDNETYASLELLGRMIDECIFEILHCVSFTPFWSICKCRKRCMISAAI